MTQRGGKRYGQKKVTPGGDAGRSPYFIEIVECQIRISGRRHSTSYSIPRHGVVVANAKADAWLARKCAEADETAGGGTTA